MKEIEMTVDRWVGLFLASKVDLLEDEVTYIVMPEPAGPMIFDGIIGNYDDGEEAVYPAILFTTKEQYASFCDNVEEIKQRLGEKSSGSNQAQEE
jgi:hypothetical protein